MKPGAKWYDSTTTATGKFTTSTKGYYTILAINATTVTIAFKGTEASSGTMEQMGMEMVTTSSNKVSSEFEVEIATGLIKQSNQTNEGTANIEMNGMSFPATSKSTVSMFAKKL